MTLRGVNRLNLKEILKTLKLNESTISMILGALVILVIGVLVVNYFRDLESGTTLDQGTTAESEQPIVKRGDGPVIYTVTQGETLWSIAELQYGSGYNWVDIVSENNLVNPSAISEGQELTIPDVEPKEPTISLADTSSGDSADPISGATYTVAEGDSLWGIAVRAYGDGYQWVEVAQENGLTNPNIIHSGNILVLPR